ncbi:RNA-guided endonuclease InsQ/TnpB family protein [Lactiplantibacillus fabifermentans]|uniref:Transposase n=2 Tax=Lactiplantibacillus fabifermentans TaxID=483011 RepID=A0A0R2NH09_9LACO|nr:RNA-guided endonuclease TnpB family protein [Lactiplantibacillus fabifermentans]ETY75385.1 transposase IS605 [Lactiplantibacillus fabifermentans T30PCM01]KRO25078.1 transposase [Lactiplantibacillus fabifermentans DSM 21115]
MIRTQKVKLYPNSHMRQALLALCDYRRYCWNQALETWNNMYDAYCVNKIDNRRPNKLRVRDELVANKSEWQYGLSSRTLQLAITDLGVAWDDFFNEELPDWGKPRFKSKRAPRQGFKTDRAKLVKGKLRLDKPHGVANWYDIRFNKHVDLAGTLKTVSIYCENGVFWACLNFEITVERKCKTKQITAVDVNVGHFNYTEGVVRVIPKRLKRLYEQIKYYQRKLAHKRVVNGKKATSTISYRVMRAKLQQAYRKATNIQHDLMQKFTTKLVINFDTIVIEDLAVKKMQMTHVASKGLHRSMFGYFRRLLTYKCDWYGKKLVLAEQSYPSTQRCSQCGYVKQGLEKITLRGNALHGTRHDQYECYQCGAKLNRDGNAVANLLALAK